MWKLFALIRHYICSFLRVEKSGGTASDQDHGNVDRDIVFAKGASTLDVSIDITDDKLVEKAEHFTVKLSSTDKAVASVQPDKTRVIIIDNDGKCICLHSHQCYIAIFQRLLQNVLQP